MKQQLIIIALAYLLAWQLGLLVYAVLFTLPYVYTRIRLPSFPWQKALFLGSAFCVLWFLTNYFAMLSLVPVGELGFKKAAREIFTDLARHRELLGLVFAYSSYRARYLLVFVAVTGFAYALIQTPLGRGLGLHRYLDLPGGYKISKNNTQGSARWSTEEEARQYLTKTGPGTILGKNSEGEPYILPFQSTFGYQRNQNITIFGTTGSGKSHSFVRPNILQADTSYVITDPKQELYSDMSGFLRAQGYDVFKFNLVDMQGSDCWNPLLKKTGRQEFSVHEAVTMAVSIVKNVHDPTAKKGDKFWDDTQVALLTALILYATKYFNPNHPDKEKRYKPSFADILRFATARPPAALDYDFAHIPKDDPAYASYLVYKQANENIRASIMISFGVTLQLFTDGRLAEITSRSDFDLIDLGRKKTAIFVVISDHDSTYNSVSALFFIQAFQELYKLASQSPGGVLPVPVRFIMDEFCNIGYIPDYTIKLSTMRSRGIFAQMIVQSLKQLENRYPGGLAAEIIGNSDTRIMMGANDRDTAEYFSNLIGRSTVEQYTHSRSDRVPVDAGNVSYREAARPLIMPDEILRLPNERQIILLRGAYPIYAQKMSYLEHPRAPLLREQKQRELYKSKADDRFGCGAETAEVIRRIEQCGAHLPLSGGSAPDSALDVNSVFEADDDDLVAPDDEFEA